MHQVGDALPVLLSTLQSPFPVSGFSRDYRE